MRSPMPASELVLSKVCFATDEKTIIDNASISIIQNGITVLLGYNGAGKSVLLKLMHGILQPDSGKIGWNEQPLGQTDRSRHAMVFQKPTLLRRSVAANVDYVLKIRNRYSIKSRRELLAKVGLSAFEKQPARLLSGGEQQRLALAQALACNPTVLYLDEATASLDPASTAIFEQIVQQQAEAGTKIIMVTHDIAQAKRLAQYIAFVDQGQIVEHSSATEFFEQPQSAVAQDYLVGKLTVQPDDHVHHASFANK